MNLLLDRKQVNHGLMDNTVRPVALLVEKSAEGVLHRAGDHCEHVSLDGGQVDDVPVEEELWQKNAVRKDVDPTPTSELWACSGST